MSLSDTMETATLQWLLTAASVTRPTGTYLALYTSDPTDASGGTEVSGGAYSRLPVTMSVTGGSATNAADVQWPEATGSWGTVTHAALHEAASGGRMLAHAALGNPLAISTGATFRVPAAALVVTLD